MGAEPRVSEPRHQLDPEGVRSSREISLARSIGEAKAWHRGDNKVERFAVQTFGEQWNQLQKFVERARPAMGRNQRERVFAFAANVHKMDSDTVDLRAKVRKLV